MSDMYLDVHNYYLMVRHVVSIMLCGPLACGTYVYYAWCIPILDLVDLTMYYKNRLVERQCAERNMFLDCKLLH